MNVTADTLPVFDPDVLPGLTPEELLRLLIEHEDRVSHRLFDACVARGDAMVAALETHFDGWRDDPHAERTPGEWWACLHAFFILGALDSDAAGRLLIRALREAQERDEEDLLEWVAGDWPQMFENKPAPTIQLARELAEDRNVGWFTRVQGPEVVVAAARREGAEALDHALDWVAALASDTSDEDIFRFSMGGMLMDFPRAKHRPLLDALVEEQLRGEDFDVFFDGGDVDKAFARDGDRPDWEHRPDFRSFYDDDHIIARQERWRREAEEEWALDDAEDPPFLEPYVRETPKLGRNDPCHCGSGKKYKKCCLASDEAREVALRQSY